MNAVALARERRDQLALLVAQHRPGGDGGSHRGAGRHGHPSSPPRFGALDQLTFGPQQRSRRVPPLAPVGRELDDLARREERIDPALDLADVCAVSRRIGDGLHDVATREGRPSGGQAVVTEESHGKVGPVRGRSPERGAAKRAAKLEAAEPVLGRAGAPLLAQPIDRDAVLLAPARLERRHLRGPRRPLAARRHVLEDLGPPLREVLDDRTRHADDVRGSALGHMPAQTQPLRQLGPQRRLVQVARGLRMPVEQAPIESRPAAVGTLRRVRDDDVGVKQRITSARRAVAERRGDEPAPAHQHRAAMPASRRARLALEVADRLRDSRLVSESDLPHDIWLADPEQHTDALRSPEREVEAGDRTRRERPPKELAGGRVLAV
jgi:hypothetical protein